MHLYNKIVTGENGMLHRERRAKEPDTGSSLSKKIISKMALITAGIFLLTILMYDIKE